MAIRQYPEVDMASGKNFFLKSSCLSSRKAGTVAKALIGIVKESILMIGSITGFLKKAAIYGASKLTAINNTIAEI